MNSCLMINELSRFIGKDNEQKTYWRKAMAESERLGDEFFELVETGRLSDCLWPL